MIYMVLMYTNSEPAQKKELNSTGPNYNIIFCCCCYLHYYCIRLHIYGCTPVYYLSQKLMLKNKKCHVDVCVYFDIGVEKNISY